MMSEDLAGQSMTMAQKSAEIAVEIARLLKSMYDKHATNKKERQSYTSANEKICSGEVSLSKLKKSGEGYSMQTNISSIDMKVIADKAKSYDIPIAFIGKGESSNVTVAFRNEDKAVFQQILQDIMQDKLATKPDDYLAFTVKAGEAETLSEMLKSNGIPADFVKDAKGNIQCVYEAKNASAVKVIKEDFKELHNEVAQNLDITAADRKVTFSDKALDKSFTLSSLPTKEKLASVLQEQFGYDRSKALEAANKFESTLTGDRLRYFRTDTRQVALLSHFERNIRWDDDSLLTKPYTYSRATFSSDSVNRYLISGGDKAAALIPSKMSRAEMEDIVKTKLGIDDSEVIKAVVDKAEKIEAANRINDLKREAAQGKGDFGIERLTGNYFEVSQGDTKKRYSLQDKNAAIKALSGDFGISEKKAERIFHKAKKQSVIQNDLHKAQAKSKLGKDTVKHKNVSKGART